MKKKILFYELTWSEITAAQKQMLVYDYSQLYASRRVVFNQMMKKFLDNALPDAVFYMSSGRDLILQSAAQAMCWMLRTDWEDLPSYQQGSCRISASEQMAALGEQNVVFITHSLGSKIFGSEKRFFITAFYQCIKNCTLRRKIVIDASFSDSGFMSNLTDGNILNFLFL